MTKVRAIIAGSRTFNDYEYLKSKVSDFFSQNKDAVIISGGCRGADKLGERFAKEMGIDCVIMEADWDKHGRSAGPIRNELMAKVATHCFIFWDGQSHGSKHMLNCANKAGVATTIFFINTI